MIPSNQLQRLSNQSAGDFLRYVQQEFVTFARNTYEHTHTHSGAYKQSKRTNFTLQLQTLCSCCLNTNQASFAEQQDILT